MSVVRFEYQIPAEEYVAAGLLYHKTVGRSRRRQKAAFWIAAGVFLVVLAFNARPPQWAKYDTSLNLALTLLALIGVWWIWVAMRSLFLARFIRRHYRSFEYAGKSFQAEMDQNGFRVTGEFMEWLVKWPGVSHKAEDGTVFLFVAGGVMFILGKKFLPPEQQDEIRKISGLAKS